MVRVSGPDPAVVEVGLIEVTVGAAGGGVVPVPPELEVDPEQPVSIADAERHRKRATAAEVFMRFPSIRRNRQLCSDAAGTL
jgi:hypothetical protein